MLVFSVTLPLFLEASVIGFFVGVLVNTLLESFTKPENQQCLPDINVRYLTKLKSAVYQDDLKLPFVY